MSKEDKELKEITFDSWDANGSPITVDTDALSSFGTDVITVTNEDLKDDVTISTGPSDLLLEGVLYDKAIELQGDLFNGWPSDGDPITITVDRTKKD